MRSLNQIISLNWNWQYMKPHVLFIWWNYHSYQMTDWLSVTKRPHTLRSWQIDNTCENDHWGAGTNIVSASCLPTKKVFELMDS